jgi:hypothetical protein
MSDISHFESRKGDLKCTSGEVFGFVTDIRNFEQFIPRGAINKWQAEKESCTFSVSMVGTVTLRLIAKEPFTKVIFDGDALKKNDFILTLNILDGVNSNAEVKVSLDAELNPMLKMMAEKPIIQFLELLIIEMENFRGWRNIIL